MSEVIGYTTAELIELMLNNGIHCSLDRFKSMAAAIQQKALGVTGPAVEMRVIETLGELPADHVWDVTS
jgi:hypothetical protein